MSSGPLKRPRDAREEEQHVDWAIAASLAEAENEQPDALLPPGHWHCVRCTLVNKAESGRCAACEADREAPFTAAACGVATTPPPQRCGLPGCNRGRLHHGFCTDDHKQRAERRGLLAPAAPGVERVFVGSTGEYACDLLTRASPERSSVIEQFTIAWRKPGTVPRVERVYAIRPPPALSERFARHLAAVGNERRRFHGTGATCDFAVDLNRAPCNSRGCALCSILGHGISCPRYGMQLVHAGFLRAHAGSGPNASNRAALRYGPGLYFSSTSGKSNDYATHSERLRGSRRWRTMPPDGYDSIVGEVGANLNYDELVVYNEAAALPRFLLVYSSAR
ncbi:hypothetical protein EMIHUDRAFT_244098 [Emiliania huxleyi CCMP1516]|uniref:RanBP2-type domain-containing protein n=2 Tax=Emiliania huxleyi TaxID=2903 RepID=A0A0D3J1W2_EMIH1|nr:hypothetical protein EMIHUDRAFT_244098 [Emiliania huxleyi CCMP1516]EOD17497.1 hypothetical protein EMIHUDRAFT_244098 [Emiliania huxleyi CCMP1516]|eukprot:XP_005769926.1 hypothetical protein EMIHUDRAFT_244098 [Emiliania huxleyi CCMP1516]